MCEDDRLPTRRLGLIAAIAMSTPVLVACGGDNPGATTPPRPPSRLDHGRLGANFEQLVTASPTSTTSRSRRSRSPGTGQREAHHLGRVRARPRRYADRALTLPTFADSGALRRSTLHRQLPGLACANFPDGVAGAATLPQGLLSAAVDHDTRVLLFRTGLPAAQGFYGAPATWDEMNAYAKVLAGRGDDTTATTSRSGTARCPYHDLGFGRHVVDAAGNVDFYSPAFASAVDLYTGLHPISVPKAAISTRPKASSRGWRRADEGPISPRPSPTRRPSSTASGASPRCPGPSTGRAVRWLEPGRVVRRRPPMCRAETAQLSLRTRQRSSNGTSSMANSPP